MIGKLQEEHNVIMPEPISVLAPNGAIQPGEDVEEGQALLLKMYRWMVLGRVVDKRFISLQRQGRLANYTPIAGQEAVQVGCGLALRQEDWLFSSYRDGLACVVHGMPIAHIFYFFHGHPRAGMMPPSTNVFMQQVGVAEQIPHAVGVAWGMKLRKVAAATLALFGDGATSEGIFHESANFAGTLHIPVVLVCQNNGWAISTPQAQQTASKTIAQKATAYGIRGRLVDGNDVIAVYREVRTALEQARTGLGPTLIEAQTYRTGPHSTADDPHRYRSTEEVEAWQEKRDPIARLRAYLEGAGLWNGTRQREFEDEICEQVARSVDEALAEPLPSPGTLFDHVYATPTPLLEDQRQELLKYL